jgi:5-methylthioadenosine/S-adenosylhomocysteine deaminase
MDDAARCLRGGWIITQDDDRRILRGDILLRNGVIEAVGEKLPAGSAEEIDARDFVVTPGLINLHTHVANALIKGIADERDFPGFLEIMFQYDRYRNPKDLEAGALLGGAEMLLSGTTAFLDMYYGEDSVARACERLGLRGFLGWAVLDPEITTQTGVPVENARRFIRQWKGHPLVEPLVAPQGVYACRADTWSSARDLAREEGTLLHYHLSETRGEVEGHRSRYGERPVEWLSSQGLLGPGQVAAHAVWLTQREIGLLAKAGVGTVHCPSSNMKLASGEGGVSPVPELREAGVVVGLGTDSSTSNNSLSVLREMRLAGLVQKHHRHDARTLSAQEILDMATRDGARALRVGDRLGQIAPGFQADLVMYDLRDPSWHPVQPETLVSNLVWAASEASVSRVYVQGREVVRDHRLLNVDPEELRRKTEEAWTQLSRAVGSAGSPAPPPP